MRNPEHLHFAHECLRLAATSADFNPERIVADARVYLAFVTGQDADDATARLAAVSAALAREP